MPEQKPINPGHESIRGVLRVLGPLVFCVGGLFMIVGLVDFFSAFGGTGPPTRFWCFFVGMPLLALGSALTKAGFLGSIARYYSQEYTPVATDTFKYAARDTKDDIRQIAGAIGEGIRGSAAASGPGPLRVVRCHRCNHDNAAEARFCSQCGVALGKNVPCAHCNELNDPDAKFCDNCGKPM